MTDQEFGVEDYKVALLALQKAGKLPSSRLNMLAVQYHSEGRDLTAGELASYMGWSYYSTANSNYGVLGKLVGAELLNTDTSDFKKGWWFLSSGEQRADWVGPRFHWTMHPALAQALQELGLVGGPQAEQARLPEIQLPEPELGELLPGVYAEGAVRQVLVNAYERNRAARQAAVRYHGHICAVCDTDLVEFYGPIAAEFIHVHHLKPLSEIGEGYRVNLQTDLIPVCPNCHAMLHRHMPPLTVEELRERIQEAHR